MTQLSYSALEHAALKEALTTLKPHFDNAIAASTPLNQDKARKLFISYPWQNTDPQPTDTNELTRSLHQLFETIGFTTYHDLTHNQAGSSLEDFVNTIHECGSIVLCLTHIGKLKLDKQEGVFYKEFNQCIFPRIQSEQSQRNQQGAYHGSIFPIWIQGESFSDLLPQDPNIAKPLSNIIALDARGIERQGAVKPKSFPEMVFMLIKALFNRPEYQQFLTQDTIKNCQASYHQKFESLQKNPDLIHPQNTTQQPSPFHSAHADSRKSDPLTSSVASASFNLNFFSASSESGNAALLFSGKPPTAETLDPIKNTVTSAALNPQQTVSVNLFSAKTKRGFSAVEANTESNQSQSETKKQLVEALTQNTSDTKGSEQNKSEGTAFHS